MKRMTRLTLKIVALSIIISGLMTFSSPVEAQGTAPVLIYYYVWWFPEVMGPGKTPDWPDPLYYSSDYGVMDRQVSQMAQAGVDGMVVGWFGPQESTTEERFKTVLDLASAHGTTALLSVDLGTAAWFDDPQEVIDGMQYAMNTHVNHPAYFRYNGKPVFVFWFQGRYSLDQWAAIRQAVDPNHDTIWIVEGAMPDAIGVFDGLHMYTISWAENVAGTLSHWSGVVHNRGGLWMATSMPGWDNTYTQQSEKYIRERGDGAFFRESFAGAAASGPDMILITSWNEWVEGSYVEPSVKYSDFYLNLMGQLISEYKGSGAVSGGGGSAPPVQPTQAPPTSVPDTGDAQPTAISSPIPPAGGGSDQPTPIPATARPTSQLPPTITPTVAGRISPTVEVELTSIAIAATPVVQEEVEMDPSAVETAQASNTSLEKFLLGFGVIAGGIGLMLLGIVGAMLTRRGKKGAA